MAGGRTATLRDRSRSAFQGADLESIFVIVVMDSGLAVWRRPGMTKTITPRPDARR
jgi:hypothetical protein